MEVHMNKRFNDFQWFVCRLCGFDAINRLQFRMHSISLLVDSYPDRWDFSQVERQNSLNNMSSYLIGTRCSYAVM